MTRSVHLQAPISDALTFSNSFPTRPSFAMLPYHCSSHKHGCNNDTQSFAPAMWRKKATATVSHLVVAIVAQAVGEIQALRMVPPCRWIKPYIHVSPHSSATRSCTRELERVPAYNPCAKERESERKKEGEGEKERERLQTSVQGQERRKGVGGKKKFQ